MKTTKRIFVLFLLVTLRLATTDATAQELSQFYQFSPKEMETMFKSFSDNKGWVALQKELEKRGLKKINHEKAAWGFKGKMKDKFGKSVDVLWCAFDYYNPSSKKGQGATMIWKKIDTKIKIIDMIFPEGVPDMSKAIGAATVISGDNSGNVKEEPQQNWGSCFLQCVEGKSAVVVDANGIKFEVPGGCAAGCVASIAVCGGATAVLAVATSPAAPVSFPTLAIVFGICAGASCGVCLGVCAVGCL